MSPDYFGSKAAEGAADFGIVKGYGAGGQNLGLPSGVDHWTPYTERIPQ